MAIGKIANFLGIRMGTLSMDRMLKTFGFSCVPAGNKTEMIAFALNQLKANPSDFSHFLTTLIGRHKLTEEDVRTLNSYLQPIGYVIENGQVIQTSLESILKIAERTPLHEEAQRMVRAYAILYLLENSLRQFIKEKLEEKVGADWWDKVVSTTIRENCENRRKKETGSPWHEVKESHPLWYTLFDELESIIQANWGVFQPHFRDQHSVIGRLSELEIARNNIAHNRLLEETELERLRVYSRDILACVGQQSTPVQ